MGVPIIYLAVTLETKAAKVKFIGTLVFVCNLLIIIFMINRHWSIHTTKMSKYAHYMHKKSI